MKIQTYPLSLLLLCATLVFGCGQKGPLFLPKDRELSEQQKEKREEQLKQIEEEKAPGQY